MDGQLRGERGIAMYLFAFMVCLTWVITKISNTAEEMRLKKLKEQQLQRIDRYRKWVLSLVNEDMEQSVRSDYNYQWKEYRKTSYDDELDEIIKEIKSENPNWDGKYGNEVRLLMGNRGFMVWQDVNNGYDGNSDPNGIVNVILWLQKQLSKHHINYSIYFYSEYDKLAYRLDELPTRIVKGKFYFMPSVIYWKYKFANPADQKLSDDIYAGNEYDKELIWRTT